MSSPSEFNKNADSKSNRNGSEKKSVNKGS